MKKIKKFWCLMMILFIFITGCTTSGIHLFTVKLTGEIRDNSILNQPIKGVQIVDYTGKMLGVTDAAGQFLVEATTDKGVINLSFQHVDFETHSLELVVDGKSTHSIQIPTLYLKPAGEKISGRIYRQLITPEVVFQTTYATSAQKQMTLFDSQVVQGEYNLVIHEDKKWLTELLKDRGKIIYDSHKGLYTIRLNPDVDSFELVNELEKSDVVEFITPNYLVETQGNVAEPENELDLWNMQMLDMPTVWEYSTGIGVTVAVLDSLHTSAHPELVNMLPPPVDITGEGENLYLNGHGLHVAGIIAAVRNNVGVVGVAPDVSILPIRVFDRTEIASISSVVQGIYQAIEAGVDVINMSLGAIRLGDPAYDFPDLHTAIKDAYEAGIVLVAAAGNSVYGNLLYPAAYPEVIAVGAVNIYGERAEYSNYGPGIELMAPGGDDQTAPIVSTGWDKTEKYGYAAKYGTSMAAPHVSGVAALLISSGITDPDYIRLILRETAIDMDYPGYDLKTGYGLVNPFAVLHRFEHSYVFFGSVEAGFAQVRSQVIQVEVNGSYELSGVRPGPGRVVGWIDMNANLLIDSGDYLGESIELEVISGDIMTDVDVELKLVPGEFSAIDIGAIVWEQD